MLYILLFIIIIFVILWFLWKQDTTNEHFWVGKSRIAGEGLFCSEPLMKDQRLFKAITSDHQITEDARKINHCNRPNTYMIKEEDGWWVYAKKDLEKDTELSIDYRDTPDFIKKPDPSWIC